MAIRCLLVVLLGAVAGQIVLRAGISAWGEVTEKAGGHVVFSFPLKTKASGVDLTVSATVFSDWAAPDLYMSAGQIPTSQSFEFASWSWGAASIDIAAAQIKENTTYYIRADCETFCMFTLTLHYQHFTELQDGLPLQNFLITGQSRLYYFGTPLSARSLTIEAVPVGVTEKLDMFVAAGRASGPALPVTKAWYRGQRCYVQHPSATVYWVSIVASSPVEFLIKAYSSAAAIHLMADFPTADMLEALQWRFYQFHVDNDQEAIFIMRTIYTGDMEVYLRAGALPTKELYTLRAGHNDTITVESGDRTGPGTYYIGVEAKSPCSFLLAVSMNRLDFMPLFPGLSQVGIVSPGELFYFYMDVPVQASLYIMVNLHPLSGSPDLYLKLCTAAFDSAECRFNPEEISSPETHPNIEYAKGVEGNEGIAFMHGSDFCPGTLCRYILCVAGAAHSSTFTIVASYDDDSEIYLRDSSPVALSIPQGWKQYFEYQVLDPSAFRLGVQMTTVAGKAELCVSNRIARPEGENCLKAAHRSAGVEQRVDFVKGTDDPWVNGTYYATVTAETAVSFTILVHEQVASHNTTIALYPGQVQRDRLVREPQGGFRLYSFEVRYTNETKREIDITLTPFAGRFHVYVANSDKTYDQSTALFAYNWSTEASSAYLSLSNTLRILPTDPAYLLSSVYAVLVLPIDWNSDNTTSYSIVYTSGDGLITLSEGVALKDRVEDGQFRYYLFPVAGVNSSITVFLTDSSGDPDLYLSLNPAVPHPSPQHHDWAGERYGGEAVTIDWTAERKALCQHSTHICGLYISVYGYTEAVFSLLVSSRPDQLILVEKGPSIRGELLESQNSLYYTPIHTLKPLKITLDPILGYSQLSLRVSPDPASTFTNIFTSEANITAATIYLTPEMYPSSCKSACYADFKVTCKSNKCRFEAVITQDEEIQLSAGKPITSHCERDEVAYFSYFNSLERTNLVVSLAALSGGDPDLYVSKGERPGPDRAQWTSTNWHSDLVEILDFQGDMRGEYYIGVACDVDSSFSIVITSGQIPLVRLSNGRAFNGFLPSISTSYFYYINDLRSNLTLTLTPSRGQAGLYVAVHNDKLGDIFEALPNPLNYTWASNEAGRVVIPTTDAGFCTDCAVLIAVVTESAECQYTLLVHNEEQFTILPNGIPVRIHLPAHTTRLIAYELVVFSDLDIAMTVYGGSPDLYLSRSPMVSSKDYVWTTATSRHVEHIHVNRESQEYRVGWYYGVIAAGSTEAVLAVAAHSRDTCVRLVDGWPQTYSISYSPLDRLLFQFDVRNQTVVCRVNTWTVHMHPTVYVKYREDADSMETMPGPADFLYKFEDYDVFGVLEMNFPIVGFGRLTLAVHSSPQSGFPPSDTGDFQLTCSASSSVTLISLSDRQYGFVDTHTQSRRYELRVPEEGQLVVWLMPCWGSVELQVAMNGSEAGKVDIQAKRVEDGTIRGSLQAKAGVYFLSVRGLKSEELAEGVNYQLTTELLTPIHPLTNRLFPGNSGLIEWEELTGSIVRLRWAPPESAAGDPISTLSTTRYRIYASVNSSVLMNTACGMIAGEDRNLAWLALPSGEEYGVTEVQIEVESNTAVTINVMAIAGLEDQFLLETVPYTPIEVYLTGTRSFGYLYKLLLAVAGLVLALLIGALYLYLKSRRIDAVTIQLTEMASLSVQRQFSPQHRTVRTNEMLSPRDTTNLMRNARATSEASEF